MNRTNRTNRFLAGLIAVMVLALVLFSSAFIAANTHHDCSGHDCPVCACIEVCEQALEKLGSGIAILFAALFAAAVPTLIARTATPILATVTPITQKVRLNN